MTIMNRLSAKGLLVKSQEGATFCYKATQEKEALIKNAIKTVLSSLAEDGELNSSSVDERKILEAAYKKKIG